MTDIRLATRGSMLAVAQARWVAEQLVDAHPGLDVGIVEITTSGDLEPHAAITSLTEVGAFVRAVQAAVLRGEADVAVHSCKDLPVGRPDGGLRTLYPLREVPWDVLSGSTIDALPYGARVGTGSPRRAAQLRLLRPDLDIADIRGNVDTRLGKVESGRYAAVVLAEAGLRRIGRSDAVHHRFSLEEMVPSPGQAALALETVPGSPAEDVIGAIEHAPTRIAVEVERAILAATGAGCRAALGVLAVVEDGEVHVTGFVQDDRGPRRGAAKHAEPMSALASLREEMSL